MAVSPRISAPAPPLMAVGLLSAAVLAYEILLMRLFAIVHWHHFAFMMISVALLGYGASGTLLTLLPPLTLKRLKILFLSGAAGFSLASLVCFDAAQLLPFNALEIFWAPRHWGYLAGIYGLLFIPFFMAASGIGAVLQFHAARIPQIYAADLVGAGMGACAAAGLLLYLPPSAGLALVSAGGSAAAVSAGWHWRLPGRRLLIVIAAGWLLLVGLVATRWPALSVNTYKPLTQTLRLPGARQIYTRHHPMGWVSAIASPKIPFRHAPGLSLNSNAAIPEQVAIFVDGKNMHTVDRYHGRSSSLNYLRQTIGSVGLHLRSAPERVFIADAGGGQEILRAIAYDARQIKAVDPHPLFPRLLQAKLRAFGGWTYIEERVDYQSATVRAFLKSPGEGYDIIQLPATGTGASGVSTFGLNPLLTMEGLEQLWRQLSPEGLIVMPFWTRLPPRDSLKAFLMALSMLEDQGISRPADHLAVVRDWRTAVIIVGRSALRLEDLNAIRKFCRKWGFDLVFLPGLRREKVNRHNVMDTPILAEAARSLAGAGREEFVKRYKFDLRPPTDDRPFFGHFFKWRSLPEIVTLRRTGRVALLDWGYPVLLATLVQAVLFSLVLIGLPALWGRRGKDLRKNGRRQIIVTLIYFSTIGGGFIFLEMAFMQRLTLFLHHPLLSATLALGGFLLGAAGGSIIVHLGIQRGFRAGRLLGWSLAATFLIGLIELLAMPGLILRFIGLSLGFKLILALGLILPLAVAMGMAFPLGMAVMTNKRSGLVPWAWGINGCATVTGAVLVPLLAMSIGYTAVMGLALWFYFIGFVAVRFGWRAERTM